VGIIRSPVRASILPDSHLETVKGGMTGPINIPSAQRSRASSELGEMEGAANTNERPSRVDRDKTVVTAPNAQEFLRSPSHTACLWKRPDFSSMWHAPA